MLEAVPNPRSPHRPRSAHLLPVSTRQPWGPSQQRSPLPVQSKGAWWHRGQWGIVQRANREQRQRCGGAQGPPRLFALDTTGLGRGPYASPSQQCTPIPTGPTRMDGCTLCSMMLAPTRLEVFSISFLPAGNMGAGAHSWWMAPIPGVAGEPGCSRAWRALQLWERDRKEQEGKRGEKKEPLCSTILGLVAQSCGQEEGGSHEPPIRAPQQDAVIVWMGKLRREAAGTQVAQAVTGLSAPLSLQPWVELVPLHPPGQMESIPGGGIRTGSRMGKENAIPASSPATHGNFTCIACQCQGKVLGSLLQDCPPTAVTAVPCPHTHPWHPTRSAPRALGSVCSPRLPWLSLALYCPLWVPVPLASKEKGSLSDSHPP